jgi:hypothetical protein
MQSSIYRGLEKGVKGVISNQHFIGLLRKSMRY